MADIDAEKEGPEFKQRNIARSRSPHPYNLSPSKLPQTTEISATQSPFARSSDGDQGGPPKILTSGYFDADHRKRRKHFDGSSESATDADDEKETLLSLPAPALRPRKGLKGDVGSGSPLLTPSYLDDEERTVSRETKARSKTTQQSQNTDAETAKLRDKFRRRRRAEFIRRATETALFLAISSVGVRACLACSQSLCTTGSSLRDALAFWKATDQLSALSIFTLTICGLYLLYPLRIIFHNRHISVAKEKPWYYIHFPAAFDPAPLLYPVFLPASVACLVGRSSNITFVPNLILGISSVPSKIVPLGHFGWCSSLAWGLSIMPMLNLHRPVSHASEQFIYSRPEQESLSLLHPLHQILMPVLQSLTTTSLLPAELQMLSVGLINLYILSDTPQALILKAVLWIGPVGILILCSKLLRVGVAIARIPSWRLRRPSLPHRYRLTIVQALYDLSELLGSRKRENNESSDDETARPTSRLHRINHRLPRIQTFSLDGESPFPALQKVPSMPATSDDLHVKPSSAIANGHVDHFATSRRHRSNTLPVVDAKLGDRMSLTRPGMTVAHASRMLQKASLRKLTPSQATLLRWLMAAYFYVTVILLILLPIKSYVRKQALKGSEPIAWALDYLFGDLQAFHNLVEKWHLRPWIPAWNHEQLNPGLRSRGRAEALRGRLGLANTRLLICAYAVTVIAGGIATVFRLSPVADVDTRRKVFHGMMVMMFLPTSFIDPAFIGLAFALVLVIFLALDLIRASQLPPLARPLTHFLAPYVDGRDHRGPVVVSHIFLLIGCAIPLWLSLASITRLETPLWDGWEVPTRDLSMISGIVCVGMGDAAASLFGRRYGRRRWCWSGGKSLEGSLAFAVAVVIGLTLARFWLLIGAWPGDSGDSLFVFWIKSIIAGCGASLTEAVLTGGNDNVIVPVILWVLVKGLAI